MRRPGLGKKKGVALMTTFIVLLLVTIAAVAFIDSATQSMRMSRQATQQNQLTYLCEAGINQLLPELWRPVKVDQNFWDLQGNLTGLPANPDVKSWGVEIRLPRAGEVPGVGRFAVGVIGWNKVNDYGSQVILRSVGWIDTNNNAVREADEAFKVVHSVVTFELRRSRVFDYTYFMNNYGWLYNFNPTNLQINGDVRANGDYEITGRGPLMNGSIGAASNDKLSPPVSGLIKLPSSGAPVKWNNTTYAANHGSSAIPHSTRWRPAYNPSMFGAIGSDEWQKWRDIVFDSQGQFLEAMDEVGRRIGARSYGATLQDSTGYESWTRTSEGGTPAYDLLSSERTQEIVMPDLRNFGEYITRSQQYDDQAANTQKAAFLDGTENPNYGSEAYIETYDPDRRDANGNPSPGYVRHSVDGIVEHDAIFGPNGRLVKENKLTKANSLQNTLVLVGSDTYPIRIYGPVSIRGDVIIKGTIQGQGTIYSERNLHVVGPVKYKNPPDFTGNNIYTIEQRNEKRDFTGFAARKSIIIGNPENESSVGSSYMRPPFTKARRDEYGNTIPAYDGYGSENWLSTDITPPGLVKKSSEVRYKSVANGFNFPALVGTARLADGTSFTAGNGLFSKIFVTPSQFDGIFYTNNMVGGKVGPDAAFNGSIISKDEALILLGGVLRFNYDNRIMERNVPRTPLIDINLPRSPEMWRHTWEITQMN